MRELKPGKGGQLIVIVMVIIAGMAMFSGMREIFLPGTTATNATTGTQRINNTRNPGMKKIVEAHWQGMEVVPLTWELAAKLGIPLHEKGVLIDEVTLTSAESGLIAKDVIKSLNGIAIKNIEDFYIATKRLKNQNNVSISVLRGPDRRSVTFDLIAADELGFAQLESAPMILPGDIPPHRYRGPCTDCHGIGVTGQLNPDPDNITLSPPPISKKTASPHRQRGKCKSCHLVR